MATPDPMPRSAALVALLAPLALAGSQEPPAPPSVFPAGVDQVTVDVVVVDREGTPVRGLAASDFTLLEDGVRQEVAAFEAIEVAASPRPLDVELTPPPMTAGTAKKPPVRVFVIVFDDLHLDPTDAPRARAAIEGFLSSAVATGDRLTLVVPGRGTFWHAGVPEGTEALRQQLPGLAGRARAPERSNEWMSDDEAIRIRDGDIPVRERVRRRWTASATDVLSFRDGDSVARRVGDAARTIAFDVERRTRQTLEALTRALDALSGARGRKSVILVSGGIARDSFLPGFRAVVAAARRANAAVHFVDARGLPAVGPDQTAHAAAPTSLEDVGLALQALDAGSEGAEAIAADTGGLSIRKRNDLARGLATIARESSSYYLLGYPAPAGGGPDRFRRIEVRVAREGARVRARRGYYPTPAAPSSSRPRDREVEQALDSPLDAAAIPLRAASFVLGEKGAGKLGVLLTTEIDVRALVLREEGSSSTGTLDLVVSILGAETGALHRSDEPIALRLPPDEKERLARTWLPVTLEAALAPGRYQARVVVRDAGSARLGSLLHDFAVPETRGLRISTPVLGDRLRAAGLPEPIARRVFAPSGTLHARFEVCGAAKRMAGRAVVKAGFAVAREDGGMLAASPATPVAPAPDGTLSRSFGIPLEGAAAGRYELVLAAEDEATGQRAEARVGFVVSGPEGP